MRIYPEAEPFTHLAKVPFGVKQYSISRLSFKVHNCANRNRHAEDPFQNLFDRSATEAIRTTET